MKNLKLITLTILAFATIASIVLVGCMKSSDSVQPTIEIEKKKKTRVQKYKVIIRARWSGFSHQYPNCEGGDCGSCPGMCIKVVPKETNDNTILSPQEIEDGDIFAWFSINSYGQLCIEPEGNIDNGNGTTSITENFDLGQSIASLFGFHSVIIVAGTYNITYSSQHPNGIVCLSIETE